MSKIIKVESCAGCGYKAYIVSGANLQFYCRKNPLRGIAKEVASETIHPDCPLDSLDSLIAPIKGVLHKMGESPTNQELIEAINQTINNAEKLT